MRLEEASKLLECLKALRGAGVPLKLTFSKWIKILQTALKPHVTERDAKFDAAVQKDQEGNHILVDDVQRAIDGGRVNPNQQLLPDAFRYKTPELEKSFKDYSISCLNDEVQVELSSISLSRLIQTNGTTITLMEFLDSPDSVLNSEHLDILFNSGVFV